MRPRTLGATLALVLVLVACGSPTTPTSTPQGTDVAATSPPTPAVPTPEPTPRPKPGHEVFGFVPYWEMDAGIAAHLAKTDLTTLALFSITNKGDGSLNDTQNGYKRIVGPIGQQMIREAHDRGVKVQLVYTSFGYARNAKFFGGSIKRQDKTIAALVAFANQHGFDGINADVELVDAQYVAAYGAFIGRLRDAMRVADKGDRLSVATTSGPGGASMAAAAIAAGAERVFLMGYDYHYAGSDVGASAPMARVDGSDRNLVASLDLYESLGVPVQQTILGLPLYGMAWPVDGAGPDAQKTGDGDAWIPRSHLDVLTDPAIVPELEPIEQVEIYRLPVTGSDGTPGWEVVYVDSPATLTPKLVLADARGLAGAGFWAIGYERGLPDVTKLIERFHDGKLD